MAGEPESLDVDEDLERRRRRHWYDRILMLSDGVFAIAITLLALDFHLPDHWRDLAEVWPVLADRLDAYALSFLVISVYWLAHRRFFAMILVADAPVSVLNLLVLALVALLPAATQLAHGGGPRDQAMVIYSALVVAIGFAMGALWAYAALLADLVSPATPLRMRLFLLALILLTPPLFLALVAWVPQPTVGVVPAALLGLFLLGWRLRLLALGRLFGGRSDGPALSTRSAASAAPPAGGA